MADALLSDLCRICYTEKPKYKCPRCKTATCSLPCYKKHQQRASCSGKRDPAAYLKKSQWATPAGIDQDYNYLRAVERNIEHAGEDVQARGIGVKPAMSKNIARGQRPDSVLQRYLTDHRITVERAPFGMTRQKTNRTRPTKRGNIVWTIEWTELDGPTELQHDCLESATIASLYTAWRTEKLNKLKPRLVEEGSTSSRGSKRKREEVAKKEKPSPMAASLSEDQTVHSSEQTQAHPIDPPPAPTDLDANPASKTEPEATSHDHPSVHPLTSPLEDDVEKPQHFYLLVPNTATPGAVVHPLDPTTSLTACLHARHVQEYPTIYISSHGPADLPAALILEATYRARLKDEMAAVAAQQPRRAEEQSSSTTAPAHSGGEVDAQSILAMLKRDMRV